MANNRLMFEVGIQKAQGDYDKIYNEVMKLVEVGKDGIKINVKFDETQGLKALTDLLKNLGDGKLLQPLVEKINALQVSLAKFGAVPKDLDMSAVQKQLKAIDSTMANIEKKRSNMQKAGISKEEIENKLTADNGLLRSQREQLEKMTSMTEQAARIVVENYKKMQEAAKNAGSGATIKVDGLEQLQTKVVETSNKVNEFSEKFQGNMAGMNKTVETLTENVNRLVDTLSGAKKIEINTSDTQQQRVKEAEKVAESEKVISTEISAQDASAQKVLRTQQEIEDTERRIAQLRANITKNEANLPNFVEPGRSVMAETITREKQELATLEQKIVDLKAQQVQNETNLANEAKLVAQAEKSVTEEEEKQAQSQRILENRFRALKENANDFQKAIENISNKGDLLKIDQTKMGLAKDAIRGIIAEFESVDISKLTKADLSELRSQLALVKSQYRSLVTDADQFNKTVSKADKEYMREVDKFTEQSKKAYAQAEKEKQKEAERTRKANEAAAKAQEQADKKAIRDLEIRETGQRRYNGLLKDMQNQMDRLTAAKAGGDGLGVNVGKTEQAIIRLQDMIDKTLNMDVRNFGDMHYITEYAAAWKAVKDEIKAVAKEQEKLNDKQEKTNTRNQNQAIKEQIEVAKNASRENEKWASSMDFAKTKANELKNTIERMENVVKNAKPGVDTTGLQHSIEQMKQNLQTLYGMMGGAKIGGTAQEFVGSSTFKMPINDAQHYAQAISHAKTEISQLTESEQRLANAIKTSTESMRGQSMVLSDLRMMAYQYLSVWGAQNFVNKIIETGGLLEQQRLSLSAILGDMDKANELFGQVKALALKSPFGVVQIDQMTKQLAAYGFEYEELFDWTKRLADISAATGTEVSRLALALGHVRAEGALSGYTLRQFSMGNVPLLKMLSESRGVSTKEIRDLVRKKEISDKEVQNVLMKLTDEGGMFYNAQEVMSQALNAKFKNLRDAFDIMYGEIAESGVGDFLKDIATALTSAAKQWKRFGTDIKYVALAFGVCKIAALAMNSALGKGTAATLKSALAQKKHEVANLELTASYRRLTDAELRTMKNKNKLNATNISTLLTTKKLTYAELERAVALGKVDKKAAVSALYLAKMRKEMWMLQQIQPLKGLARTFAIVEYNIKRATMALKTFMRSFGPMIAIGAIVDIFSSKSQQEDNANSRGKEQAIQFLETRKAVKDIYDSLNKNRPQTLEETTSAVEEMTEALKGCGHYTTDLNNELKNTPDVTQKYDILYNSVKNLADGYDDLKVKAEAALKAANNVGGGYGSENMLEDFQDLNESYMDYMSAKDLINDPTYASFIRNILANVLRQRHSNWQEIVDNSKDNEDLYRKLDETDRYQLGRKLANSKLRRALLPDAVLSDTDLEGFKTLEKYFLAIKSYNEDYEEVMKQLPDFTARANVLFKQLHPNIDLNNMTDEQKSMYIKFIREWMETYQSELVEPLQRIVGDKMIELKIPMFLKYEINTSTDGKTEEIARAQENNPLIRPVWFATLTSKEMGLVKTLDLEKKFNAWGITYDKLGEAASTLGKKRKEYRKKLKVLEKEYTVRPNDTLKGIIEQTKEDLGLIDITGKTFSLDIQEPGDSGSHEDKKAKELRERARILKEAESSFQYWRKAVGEGASKGHVNEEYGETLGKLGYSFENIQKFKKTIEDLKDEYQKIYDASKKAGKDRPQLLEALKELDKILADIKRKDFEKTSKDFASNMTHQIEELTRKWEIYNSVVESTGDRALAGRMSGVAPGATVADLKRINLAQMSGVHIDFDKVLGMSDKEIEEYVYTLGVVEYNIEGIQNGLKDWKKAELEVMKSDIQNYAKWLGGLSDITSIMARNQQEYNKALEETNRLQRDGVISGEEADKRRGAAQLNMWQKNWQAGSMYANLYNNAQTMGRNEFMQAYNTEKWYLDEGLKGGSINKNEYDEKIKKLNDVLMAFETSGFLGIRGGVGAYLGGGYQGLIQYHQGKASELRREGKTDEAEREQEKANSMMKAQKATEQVIKAFQDLSNGANLLGNMFDALGMEGAANAFGDAAGVLGGVASGAQSLSAFGPWGAAAGATIGGITAIAQLNDKHQQRLIDKLQENVDALEANTQMIKATRARTLGYDTGELRNAMASRYSGYDTTKKLVKYSSRNGSTGYSSYYSEETPAKSAAQKAMYEYYGGGTSGRGYSQELQNLRDQRKDFFDMYNAENDKKKKSKKTLNEYKQKIAELDAEIMDYLQNLTKELWGIDLKGWASQISDALMTAFENGTSAATAFGETATDILKGVFKQMMTIGLLEPMMNKLQKTLFGEIDKNTGEYTGGIVNMEDFERDPEGTANRVLSYTMQFFRNTMNPMITAYQKAFSSFSDEAAQYGFDVKGSKSNTVEGIRSAASEETMGIVAGYLASIRQDVSAKRVLLTYWSEEQWPSFTEKFDRQQATLNNMFSSVRAIEVMMRDGSGAMYESVNRMSRKIDLAITPDGKMRV